MLDGAGDVAAALDGLAVNVSGVDGIDRVETVTGTYSGGERVAEPGPALSRLRRRRGWVDVGRAVDRDGLARGRGPHRRGARPHGRR
ncbi:MAG: hypothetical protein WKF58_18980 [Ilumatobacteraceae bacterium]